MPPTYHTVEEEDEEDAEEETDTVPDILQSKSPQPIDLHALSIKLHEEGYNNDQVREKLVKQLKRVRAIMMRSKSVAVFPKRLSITCLNPAEDEEECECFFRLCSEFVVV